MLTKAWLGQRPQESEKLRAEIKRSTRDNEEQQIKRATRYGVRQVALIFQIRRFASNKNEPIHVNRMERHGNGNFTAMTFTAINETELVSRAQNGERNAFSELVRIYAQGVIHVIYRMCGDVHIAEDAAQETFIQAWLHLSSYRTQISLRNWLYRIAVNAATDMLRKQKRILPDNIDDLQLTDGQPGPELLVSQQERTARVQRAVLSLPDASRAVLVLREYEGMAYREIADALDIPVGTVMSRLNYARKLLKDKLEPELFIKMEVEHV
jgi:RNA polymerase sigma-70 factor, ECF subfamily